MRTRAFLAGGMAMPLIYLAALVASAVLLPGYRPLDMPPSILGGPTATHPYVFNIGVVTTGLAGASGAVGLIAGFPALRRDMPLTILGGLTGLTLLAGSTGLAMSGVFPLPDPRHYGFGMTALAAFTPLLGALALLRAGGARLAGTGFAGAFALVLALVLLQAPPLTAGLTMMVSAGLLCWSLRHRLQRL